MQIRAFLEEQASSDLPSEISSELDALDARLKSWPFTQP